MLSSNYLFHFTYQKALFSILKDCAFEPHYSNENYNWLQSQKDFWESAIENQLDEKENLPSEIPMVCFCDILPQLAASHAEIYGKYAIGLNKSWGMQKVHLNPMFYVAEGSSVTSILQALNIETNRLPGNDPSYRIKNEYDNLLPYIKPYSGYFQKNEYENKDHLFYDEREWRYVVPSKLQDRKLKKTKVKLPFSPADVKYIVVEKEEEKEEIVEEHPQFEKKAILYNEFIQ